MTTMAKTRIWSPPRCQWRNETQKCVGLQTQVGNCTMILELDDNQYTMTIYILHVISMIRKSNNNNHIQHLMNLSEIWIEWEHIPGIGLDLVSSEYAMNCKTVQSRWHWWKNDACVWINPSSFKFFLETLSDPADSQEWVISGVLFTVN